VVLLYNNGEVAEKAVNVVILDKGVVVPSPSNISLDVAKYFFTFVAVRSPVCINVLVESMPVSISK
jgi:hypothetical protein